MPVDNDHLNIKAPPREFGGHLGRRFIGGVLYKKQCIDIRNSQENINLISNIPWTILTSGRNSLCL